MGRNQIMKRFCKLACVLGILLSAANTGAFDRMHGLEGIPKLNYDSLYREAVPVSESNAGQALMDNCLESYGGVEHLKKLERLRITYDLETVMASQKQEVIKYYSRDRKLKVERHGKELIEIRVLDGATGWLQARDTVIELYSGRFKAELFTFLTLSMPVAMKTEPFDDIRYGTRADDSLGYLYMKKADTLMLVLGIDPADNMIKTSEGVIYQEDNIFVFINTFSDFRKTDGYIFPYALTNISLGLEVGRSKVTRIEINPQFADNLFDPIKLPKDSVSH